MKTKFALALFFILILSIVFRFQLGDFLLSRFGKTCLGIVVADTRSVNYVKPAFLYEFKVNEKSYFGNSMLIDSSDIGKSICIIYFPFMPSVNRPSENFKKSVLPFN
jgi:hypothetical protein